MCFLSIYLVWIVSLHYTLQLAKYPACSILHIFPIRSPHHLIKHLSLEYYYTKKDATMAFSIVERIFKNINTTHVIPCSELRTMSGTTTIAYLSSFQDLSSRQSASSTSYSSRGASSSGHRAAMFRWTFIISDTIYADETISPFINWLQVPQLHPHQVLHLPQVLEQILQMRKRSGSGNMIPESQRF